MRSPLTMMLHLILSCCLLNAVQGYANPNAGSISGKVVSSAGTAIPGARITIINRSNENHFEAVTDCSGTYQTSVLPGNFGVRFQAQGFRSDTRAPIRVEMSRATRVDARLRTDNAVRREVDNGAGTDVRLGAITGTVTNEAGVAIPASITATNETGTRYASTTDSAGVYHLSNLVGGSYDVSIRTERFRSGTPKTVIVKPAHVSCVDFQPVVKEEGIEVCSGSCPILDTDSSLPQPGIEIDIYSKTNVVKQDSVVWLTVVLRNRSDHSVFIPPNPNPSILGYEIFAFGRCSCPGQLGSRDLVLNASASTSPLKTKSPGDGTRLPPGGVLTDKIGLTTFGGLNHPGTYSVVVKRPQVSMSSKCCDSVKDMPIVWSNRIGVTVIAAE